jgi:hypothetical protein
MAKGVRMVMPEMVDFAMTEWNKLGGRQKAASAPHFFRSLRVDEDGNAVIGGAVTEMHRRAVGDFLGGALRDAHHAQARLKEWLFNSGTEGDRIVIRDQVDKEMLEEFMQMNPDFIRTFYAQATNQDAKQVKEIKIVDYSQNEQGNIASYDLDAIEKRKLNESRDQAMEREVQQMKNAYSQTGGKKKKSSDTRPEKVKDSGVELKEEFQEHTYQDKEFNLDVERINDLLRSPDFDLGNQEDFLKFRHMLDNIIEQIGSLQKNYNVSGGSLIEQIKKINKSLPTLPDSASIGWSQTQNIISQGKGTKYGYADRKRLINIFKLLQEQASKEPPGKKDNK